VPIGFGGIGITLGEISQIVWGLIASVINAIIRVLNFVFALLDRLIIELRFLFSAAWSLFRFLARAMRGLYERILKPILSALKEIVFKLDRIITGVLRVVILAQTCANIVLDAVFQKILRPIAQVFFFVRAYLKILRLFNRKLAEKIDGKIARVEQKIFGVFFGVRAAVNAIGTFAQRWFTFDGLIQPGTLWRTIIRDLEFFFALIHGGRLSGASDAATDLEIRSIPRPDAQAIYKRQRATTPARAQKTPAQLDATLVW
jgi:hypothetical protein